MPASIAAKYETPEPERIGELDDVVGDGGPDHASLCSSTIDFHNHQSHLGAFADGISLVVMSDRDGYMVLHLFQSTFILSLNTA